MYTYIYFYIEYSPHTNAVFLVALKAVLGHTHEQTMVFWRTMLEDVKEEFQLRS
jgi:hypothetical protein